MCDIFVSVLELVRWYRLRCWSELHNFGIVANSTMPDFVRRYHIEREI